MGKTSHKGDEGWSNLGLLLIFVFVKSRNITIQTSNTIEILIHSNTYVLSFTKFLDTSYFEMDWSF